MSHPQLAKNHKLLIAGGGTGGHLFSGIAVATEFQRHYPGSEVLFVGTPHGLEKELVPQSGFALKLLQVSPLKGSGLKARLKSLFKLPRAYLAARRIVKQFAPDIVLGIGGYASGPAVLAAHHLKIFTAILEQNAYPGYTNRRLAHAAARIFIAFRGAAAFFPPARTRLTGNPVRAWELPAKKAPASRFCVFVLGGSQGAHRLNQAMMDALSALREQAPDIHFVHQTGKSDLEAVQAAYAQAGLDAEVFAFSPEIARYYAQADLMICRAGAGTISELTRLGLPAILVPYPHASDDHQRYNALDMVQAGAAELLLDADCSGAALSGRILDYQRHPEKLSVMSAAAQSLAQPQAASEIVKQCMLGWVQGGGMKK